MTFNEKLNLSNYEPIDNDLELHNLKNAIFKNKKQIFYFTLAGFFLAFLFIFQKDTWKGEFEIVLEKKENSISSRFSSILSGPNSQILGNLFGNSAVTNDIKTEIEILKSPSVLIDIFEFVQNQANNKENSNRNIPFMEWRENLNFSLLKDTSVLSISYVSKEKESIIPVLNRISKKYQQYSGKKELKNINSALNFLENQIKIYTDKSTQSVKKAQEFALKYDFGISPIFTSNNSSEEKNKFPNPEEVRVKSINELRLINNQLDKIKQNKFNNDEIFYFAQSYLNDTDIPEIIKNSNKLKAELSEKRSFFKENDISIKRLINLENSSNQEVQKTLVGALKARKIELESQLDASKRPDGILIKYFQLISEAKKELQTLEELKIQSRVLSLEKEKSKEPWELITKPTLLPNPIAPKRKRILAAGIFLGLLSGCGFARFKEGRKNLILNSNQIIKLSKWDFLCELKNNDWESSSETLKYLALGKLTNSKKNISIIKVGNYENQVLDKFLEVLNKYLPDKEIKIFTDITDANKFGEIIPIFLIGRSSVNDLEIINQNLSLQDLKILGTILIS